MGSDFVGPARDLLTAWSPPDPAQRALRQEYVDFIDSRDGVHLRSSRIGHLTSSVLIVEPTTARALLTLHPTVGRWLQTGGHIEPGDRDLVDAAAREGREESGIGELVIDPIPICLDRHELSCRADDGTRTTLHHWDVQFLAVAAPDAREVMSAESDDLRWWPLDALPSTDGSVCRLARLSGVRLGL